MTPEMKTAVLAFLLLASPALADVIELKTGQRIEGTLKQATPASVTVEVGGQTITFTGDKVRAIYFGSAPGASTTSRPDLAAVAIDGLRSLNSVVSAGVSYRDYGPRLADMKIKVDPFLRSDDPRAPLRQAVEDAAAFYVLVGAAWSSEVTSSYSFEGTFGSDPLIEKCPALAARLAGVNRPGARNLLVAGIGKPVLWSCASDKLAEAERLLGGAK